MEMIQIELGRFRLYFLFYHLHNLIISLRDCQSQSNNIGILSLTVIVLSSFLFKDADAGKH